MKKIEEYMHKVRERSLIEKKDRTVWKYLQQDYRSWTSKITEDKQVIKIRMSSDGSDLRLRLSNLFGHESICFEKVVISNLETNRRKTITIDDNDKIEIESQSCLLSDKVLIDFKKGDELEIESILSGSCTLSGGIVTYSNSITSVKNYNRGSLVPQKKLFRMVAENPKMQFIYGISGVVIKTSSKVVNFFGDSLTQQGFIVDNLKQRVINDPKYNYSFLNFGIGGSRILSGTDKEFDKYTRHGYSGLFRFEENNFTADCPDKIVILHGINDIITSKNDCISNMIISGLKQYALISHLHGVKIYIGTLLPLGNSQFFNEYVEKNRLIVNSWIRNNDVYDGFFDFDCVVADKLNKEILDKKYDSGDGLHLSSDGGMAIAKSIDFSVFE